MNAKLQKLIRLLSEYHVHALRVHVHDSVLKLILLSVVVYSIHNTTKLLNSAYNELTACIW